MLTDCPMLLQVELQEAPCSIHCIPLQPPFTEPPCSPIHCIFHSLHPIAGVRMASYIYPCEPEVIF